MKKIKIWWLVKMIKLCSVAMKYKDGAESQGEINEIISTSNKAKAEYRKLTGKNYIM